MMVNNRRIQHFHFETILNVFSVFMLAGLALVFAVLLSRYELIRTHDYLLYVNSINGDFYGYYYPYWILAFVLLPLPVGYVLWSLLNIASLWYATRVFGGKLWVLMFTYQMFYMLYYGNLDGLIAAGLAFYWSWVDDKPLVSGLGAVLALAKPNITIPILIAIGLLRTDCWRKRILSVVPVLLVTIATFIIEPSWLADLLNRLNNTPPNDLGSVSLWQDFGVLVLIFWLGVLLPMTKRERLIIVISASALTLPYFQQTSLVVLYTLPVGYLPLLGNWGFLFMFGDLQWQALKIFVIVPLSIYIFTLIKIMRRFVRIDMKAITIK